MPWQPEINVFDERQAKNNLVAYFENVQANALAWANGGAGLKPIKDFHKSPRLVTVFPALTFLQTEHKTTFEDILIIDFSTTLEVALIHGNGDILTALATKYAMALESMLVNLPETTFNENSIIDTTTVIQGVDMPDRGRRRSIERT